MQGLPAFAPSELRLASQPSAKAARRSSLTKPDFLFYFAEASVAKTFA